MVRNIIMSDLLLLYLLLGCKTLTGLQADDLRKAFDTDEWRQQYII